MLLLVKERQEKGVHVTVITTDSEEVVYGSADVCYGLINEMKQVGINVVVKRKCGIEVGENYNLPKSEGTRGPVDLCFARTGAEAKTARQPQCPTEKEKAIKDALEHFWMI